MSSARLSTVVQCLADQNFTISAFINTLLDSDDFADSASVHALLLDADDIRDMFHEHGEARHQSEDWAIAISQEVLAAEVLQLSEHASGWHFNATAATSEKLEAFNISEMAEKFQVSAPRLWDILAVVLTANPFLERRRFLWRTQERTTRKNHQSAGGGSDDEGRTGDEGVRNVPINAIRRAGGHRTEASARSAEGEDEVSESGAPPASSARGIDGGSTEGDTHSTKGAGRVDEGDALYASSPRSVRGGETEVGRGCMEGEVGVGENDARSERGRRAPGSAPCGCADGDVSESYAQHAQDEGEESGSDALHMRSMRENIHGLNGRLQRTQGDRELGRVTDALFVSSAQRAEGGAGGNAVFHMGATQNMRGGGINGAQWSDDDVYRLRGGSKDEEMIMDHTSQNSEDGVHSIEEDVETVASDGSAMLWEAFGVDEDRQQLRVPATRDVSMEQDYTDATHTSVVPAQAGVRRADSETSEQMWEGLGDLGPEQNEDAVREIGEASSDGSDRLWAAADSGPFPNDGNNTDDDDMVREEGATPPREAIRETLLRIKQVTCLSIFLQSTNSRCNAFQSVIGIFLHACSTPEKVVEVLAHTGMSISSTAINNAVKSLSEKAKKNISDVGQTLLTSYAYDNFDIDFKSAVPRIEKAEVTLKHLTSATLIPLCHGIAKEDLRCAESLWASSPINPHPTSSRPAYSFDDLLLINKGEQQPSSTLTRHQQFRAWKLRYDLVHHGPKYFHRFAHLVGQPYDSVCQIPVSKTTQIPARSMDINESTTKGNVDVIETLLAQGGIAEQAEHGKVALNDHVVLFHGDLSTGERIRSVLESRSIEERPWQRLQFLIFIPGLFHLKMACADALFRIYLEPKKGHNDRDGLMKYVSIIRPRETGKMGTKPGFRRMHDVVHHTGLVLRLDCWRVEASKDQRQDITTLDGYASTRPKWKDIVTMSERIAENYVAGGTLDDIRQQNGRKRDIVFENAIIRNRDFLFYEEMSWAMNRGDVGTVENCILPWSMLFRATGKHKYATNMLRFLHDLHFVYDEKLRNTIRMNWLCNPTGKEHKFRAIDWLVELNNLYTKFVYGGSYSNRTVARILEESLIIETYRTCINDVERNFRLSSLTIKHANPDMTKTLSALFKHVEQRRTHEIDSSGRKAHTTIPNSLSVGLDILMSDHTSAVPVGDTSAMTMAQNLADDAVDTLEVNIEPEDLL